MRIRKVIRSAAEANAYRVLDRALAKQGYKVHLNMRLSEVLEREPDELDDVESDVFRKMHFDFVVTKEFSPQFVAEFDGPQHQQDSTSDRLDAVKNKFCQDAGLPMVRVSSQELEPHEGVGVLSWILERWIAWQKEEPLIRQEIAERLEELGPEAIDEMIKADAFDPSVYDPAFTFNLRHPYRAILTVTNRLHRLGIITGRMSPRKLSNWMSATGKKPRAECSASPWASIPQNDEWHVTEYMAQVIPWEPERKRWVLPDPDALYTTTQQVRMRWALPVGWGARDVLTSAPKNGDPVQYLSWLIRRMQCLWSCDLPGAGSHYRGGAGGIPCLTRC